MSGTENPKIIRLYGKFQLEILNDRENGEDML